MNIQVLLVDDDEVVLFLHNLMIIKSELATKTTAFNTAAAALDFLNQNSKEDERYLIFLDLHMPLMNGWNFLDSIQQLSLQDRISVVIATSSIDSADHERARNYPLITEFIEKPLSEEIFARIKDQLTLNS